MLTPVRDIGLVLHFRKIEYSDKHNRVNIDIRAGSVSVFKSVSVFVFLVGFSKVGIGFGIGFSKYRDIGFGFRLPTRL